MEKAIRQYLWGTDKQDGSSNAEPERDSGVSCDLPNGDRIAVRRAPSGINDDDQANEQPEGNVSP